METLGEDSILLASTAAGTVQLGLGSSMCICVCTGGGGGGLTTGYSRCSVNTQCHVIS